MALQLVKETDPYGDAFRELLRKASDRQPLWLRQTRERAFERFEHVGFPTVQNEEWKYTNVAPIARSEFIPVLDSGEGMGNEPSLAALAYEETRHSRLVFVNGVFSKNLSSLDALPNGVIAANLAEVLENGDQEARIREHFESADMDENGFTALNTALFSSGAFVLIPAGVTVEKPIHLLFVSQTTNGQALASFPRVLIVAKENSAATIVESYVSESNDSYLTNAIIDFVLETGARLQHYKIQRESASSFHIATTNADVGKDAGYDTTAINLGASLSRHNIAVSLDHEGGECAVDGLYMIDASQHTDTHSVIDHRQPRCTSHQLYKGILDGKSRAVFNGKVFVRHGAQQTDARQTNKNLLLSNEARVDTKPQLEIFADDVKCAHGAAVGRLDEDELFYLESRGIRPTLARNMLTYGFAEEVIEKIKVDSIRRELDEAVLHRLHSNLELR